LDEKKNYYKRLWSIGENFKEEFFSLDEEINEEIMIFSMRGIKLRILNFSFIQKFSKEKISP